MAWQRVGDGSLGLAYGYGRHACMSTWRVDPTMKISAGEVGVKVIDFQLS